LLTRFTLQKTSVAPCLQSCSTGILQPCISPAHHAVLDLYDSALRHGVKLGLSDTQVSALVGITRAVHERAVAERLPLAASFKHCGELLLAHSIERPPRSSAVFALADMRALTDWLTRTYFLHYSLYQYAFTPAVTLSFTAVDARSLVEAPPRLPGLAEALPEAEHAAAAVAAAAAKEKQLAEQRAQARLCPQRLAGAASNCCAARGAWAGGRRGKSPVCSVHVSDRGRLCCRRSERQRRRGRRRSARRMSRPCRRRSPTRSTRRSSASSRLYEQR
jgi:Flagellar C1a complex subunit C1a-32